MRRCTKCYELHEETFFNKDRSRPDGLYPQCKDCTRAACKRVYRKYYDKHVAAKRRWKNTNRDYHRLANRQRALENPELVREYTRQYRRRIKQATPPWVDTDLVRMVYAECPRGYHVDHVFPLHGVDFCGLHVPDNLQLLPAMDNFRKGDRVHAKYLKGLEKFAILSQ